MRLLTKTLLAAAVLAATPMLASAESDFDTGAAPNVANASLDFQIVIPRILFLQVGTGTFFADDTTVDLIAFNVPAANVGDGTSIAGTGGDIGGGTVTARVLGNGGTITLTSNTTGPLNDGGTNTISYSEITTTVAAGSFPTTLAHPTLSDTTPGSVTLTPTGGVVLQDAEWTYEYDNSAVVAAGTYGGVNTNGGRVTYTATMP